MMGGYFLNKIPRRARLAWAAAALAALAMTGCGDSKSPTAPDPPRLSLTCPQPISAQSPNGSPIPVSYEVPTASVGDAAAVACTPLPGTEFPVGDTPVQCTATAKSGQTAACSFTVTVLPPPPELALTSFLAFGDSMTLGEVTAPVASSTSGQRFGAFALQIVPSAAYPRQLQLELAARYTAQSITVVNSGVSGERATAGATRFRDVLASTNPGAVLLLEGANDLTTFGTSGISDASGAISDMAGRARGRGAKVFIATLPPSGSGPHGIPTSTLLAYNGRLASIASGQGAVLVDLYSAMTIDADTYIGPDGLHPNELGYQKIADLFFNAIRSTLERAP